MSLAPAPFRPLFRNGHVATIAGNFWSRPSDVTRFPISPICYQIEPGITILVHHQRPVAPVRARLILLHGLEGSSSAGYMQSMSQLALERGMETYRVNMRGCGGTEAICNSLYHAGLTGDLLFLLHRLRAQSDAPIFLAGFSLGANVVLKLAGELGQQARPLIDGLVAVSAPIDLAACTTSLMRRENTIYQWRFVSRLKQRMRRRHAANPQLFPIAGLDRVRTVWQFDDVITAPWFGFGDAANYYRTQSSMPLLGQISVPSLLVQAADDPLIPVHLFADPSIAANPYLTTHTTYAGGHLGFLAASQPRFWLDHLALGWIGQQLAQVQPDLLHTPVSLS